MLAVPPFWHRSVIGCRRAGVAAPMPFATAPSLVAPDQGGAPSFPRTLGNAKCGFW